MAITVEAVYENGILRLSAPLPLREHEKVRITIEAPLNWVQETAGLLGWKGNAKWAERFATDAELDYSPPAEE